MSGDKSLILKTFNNLFFQFLDEVIEIIENSKDIEIGRMTFKTIRDLNPTLILKTWYQYIYMPYMESIDNGDIHYFLEKDYKNDLEILNNSKEILEIVDNLRNPIKNMNPVNMSHCVEYIQQLCQLSKIYICL